MRVLDVSDPSRPLGFVITTRLGNRTMMVSWKDQPMGIKEPSFEGYNVILKER